MADLSAPPPVDTAPAPPPPKAVEPAPAPAVPKTVEPPPAPAPTAVDQPPPAPAPKAADPAATTPAPKAPEPPPEAPPKAQSTDAVGDKSVGDKAATDKAASDQAARDQATKAASDKAADAAKTEKPPEKGPSGKAWDDPSLTKEEFIKDYRARNPKSKLTDQNLADVYAKGQRLNPETNRFKVPDADPPAQKPQQPKPEPSPTEPLPDEDLAPGSPEAITTEPEPGMGSGENVPEPGKAGSPEHKSQRWKDYLDRNGKWKYDRWSREVTVDVEGIPRRLDIADVKTMRGAEVKGGYQTATQANLWEILRDQTLIEQGWKAAKIPFNVEP